MGKREPWIERRMARVRNTLANLTPEKREAAIQAGLLDRRFRDG